MQSFNELLAEYLEAYGDYVRMGEGVTDYRSIQSGLYRLAKIVHNQDIQALIDLREELEETLLASY